MLKKEERVYWTQYLGQRKLNDDHRPLETTFKVKEIPQLTIARRRNKGTRIENDYVKTSLVAEKVKKNVQAFANMHKILRISTTRYNAGEKDPTRHFFEAVSKLVEVVFTALGQISRTVYTQLIHHFHYLT